MIDGELIGALAGAGALGAGAGGALVAWRKAGAETEAVAVRTLRSVIRELRAELARKEKEWHAELERKEGELRGLRDRVDHAEQRVEELFRPLEEGGAPS